MKIIELLNKIANREEIPEKIQCFNREFYLKGNTYFGDTFTLMHYIQEEDLNDEVEIIEEEKKIPEKIDNNYFLELNDTAEILELYEKQCEIIDYLKSKGE